MMYVSSDYSYLEECVKGFVEDPERELWVRLWRRVSVCRGQSATSDFFLGEQEKVFKKEGCPQRLGRLRGYPVLRVSPQAQHQTLTPTLS
jgi:hypothetical protein